MFLVWYGQWFPLTSQTWTYTYVHRASQEVKVDWIDKNNAKYSLIVSIFKSLCKKAAIAVSAAYSSDAVFTSCAVSESNDSVAPEKEKMCNSSFLPESA